MRIPRWKSFTRVIVPLSLPAILEIFLYYFMNSMVTVSAVVFLYSAQFKVASIAITHMEEAGDIAQAAAMSLLILLVNIVARGIYALLVYRIKKDVYKRQVDMLYACILLSDYEKYSRKIKKQSTISDGFAIDGDNPL